MSLPTQEIISNMSHNKSIGTLLSVLLCSFVLGFLLTGCDLSKMNVNPNNPSDTEPSLLLTSLSLRTFNYAERAPAYAARMIVETSEENPYQTFKWGRSDFGIYSTTILNAGKLKEIAEAHKHHGYRAIALFLEAYYYYNLTLTFGDIPCSEANKAESDRIFTPQYDTQEQVFESILDRLQEANSLLASSTQTIEGDIIYGGDPLKWQRLTNAFALRVLMTLSHKSKAGKYNVPELFRKIATSSPIMLSAEDNGQYVPIDQQGNRYDFFNNSSFGSGMYMSSTFTDLLRNLRDPRLFAFCTQTPAAKSAGKAIDDFTAYDGGDPTIPYSLVNEKVTRGGCSKPALRYYRSPTNEPFILMGYTEQQLLLAEGVVRGWISGDDKAYYDSAVRASFDFYAKYSSFAGDPTTQEVPKLLSPAAADAYLAGAAAYSSSMPKEDKLKLILTQKYIPNYFQPSTWMAFYEHVRTGYPEFAMSEGMTLPARFMYPTSEYNNNLENVTTAVERQFGKDNDKITSRPWWVL